MFNLKKMLGYAGRILMFILFIVFLTVILSVLTKASEIGIKSASDLIREFLYVLIVITLPFFAAAIGALFVAGAFVKAVYKLNGIRDGIEFIMHQRFDRPGFRPFLLFSQGKIAMGADGPLPLRGGPGGLVIQNDTAVVTEKRGKLGRVEGVGFPALEPFEKIYDVIDLQPKRWVYPVGAMTKEGIPITWPVEIRYRIDSGGQESTSDTPYPFSKEAVFKAATGKWRREISRKQDMNWEGWVVISQTEGTFRSMLARRHLDELIGLTKKDNQTVRETLQKELEQAISAVAPKVGAKILDIKLHNLKVEDEVTQQWIEAWRAGWQRWSTEELAPVEAKRIKDYEKAKAEAQAGPLGDLIQGLDKLDVNPAILFARLESVLDRDHADVASQIHFPSQALGSIEDVRRLLRRDNGGGGGGDSPRKDNGGTSPPRPSSPPDSNDTDGIEWRSRIIRRLPVIDSIAAGTEKSISDEDTIGYIDILIKLPVTDEVEAGEPKPVSDENYDEYLQQTDKLEFEFEGQLLTMALLKGSKLSLSKDFEYFAVRVSGDSMNEANISPNDYVILRQTNVPRNRDIVAVVFRDEDDKATLKRIFIGRDGVTLKPESSNPKHQPRSLPPRAFAGDNPQVQVVGIAIAVLKQVN